MVNSLLTAVKHLSILPLGSRYKKVVEGREGEVLVFFPLAGFLIALAPASVLVLAWFLTPTPSPLPAALAVAALALIGGGANLINLAGTTDAAVSSKSGANALDTDPAERIGAAGALAMSLALLVKFAALMSMTNSLPQAEIPSMGLGPLTSVIMAVILAVVLGRWAMVILAAYTEYARPEGGDDEWMVRYCTVRELRWSLAPALFLTVLPIIAWMYDRSQLGWIRVLMALGACWALSLLGSIFFEKRFGGVTGRQLGAVAELTETAALVICAMPAAKLFS